MTGRHPKKIRVVIYPNQLEWIDRIGKTLHQSRRQTFLQCFSQFIGGFKAETRFPSQKDRNE